MTAQGNHLVHFLREQVLHVNANPRFLGSVETESGRCVLRAVRDSGLFKLARGSSAEIYDQKHGSIANRHTKAEIGRRGVAWCCAVRHGSVRGQTSGINGSGNKEEQELDASATHNRASNSFSPRKVTIVLLCTHGMVRLVAFRVALNAGTLFAGTKVAPQLVEPLRRNENPKQQTEAEAPTER